MEFSLFCADWSRSLSLREGLFLRRNISANEPQRSAYCQSEGRKPYDRYALTWFNVE